MFLTYTSLTDVEKFHNRHQSSEDQLRYGPTLFMRERAAYERLNEEGLCERGIVPRYYGHLDRVDPESWSRQLDAFSQDPQWPSAIFIEYIPDMKMLDLDTYSRSHMIHFIENLRLIHGANIEHGDPMPRNMMVSKERVIWIDFDHAVTYDLPALSAVARERLNDEMQLVVELDDVLVSMLDQL